MESKLFHRSTRKNQKNWLGFRHWLALRDCTSKSAWLSLGYQLAKRSCKSSVRSLNINPVVTQFCLVSIAIAAAVAIP